MIFELTLLGLVFRIDAFITGCRADAVGVPAKSIEVLRVGRPDPHVPPEAGDMDVAAPDELGSSGL